MPLTILTNIIGIFAINENGDIQDIVSKKIFKSRDAIPEKLYSLQKNEIIPELKALLSDLKEKGMNDLILEDNELAKEILKIFEFNIEVQKPSKVGKKVRENLFEFGKKLDFFKSLEDYKKTCQETNIKLTRKNVKKASESKDKLIIQAIESVDDIDKSLNIFVSRIREWYGLHFPELNKKITNHTTFVKLASKIGFRSNYTQHKLIDEMNYSEEKAQKIASLAKKSMGSEILKIDLLPIQEFANYCVDLYQLRDELSKYIDESMMEVAPNIRGIVGAMLGARLISAAGGILELAQKPSSTVQVLGAERALFRSLKTGAKPPKHGIIFQWDPIHNAKWWLRGKIARATASKLSIAARVDAFSGEYMADNLLESLKATINELNIKHPEPPKKKKEERAPKPKKKKFSGKKKKKSWDKKKKRDKKKKKKKKEDKK
ncbi:MAG: C/D box methylation guide ribonucleoprotein complex aNOP56 subunit [Candidatus Helarchaeota archaeon]